MKKKLTLLFNHYEFGLEHLGKDVFLLPYYIGKKNNYEVDILYPKLFENHNLPSSFRNVNLIPVNYRKNIPYIPFWKHLNFYLYLIKNARKIDLLMRFHLSGHTYVSTLIYKILNRKGKVYLKLDINTDSIDKIYCEKKINRYDLLQRLFARIFKLLVTHVSCETKSAYEKIIKSNHYKLKFNQKLKIVPNGFDEEYFKSFELGEKLYSSKENIIITVGRIGSKEKNHDMFLKALESVDLCNWTVYFIGPILAEFDSKINEFFIRNPNYKDRVIFTGNIGHKKTLWEYYNKSKVFVLTSNKEGFPIVFSEAKRFRNFLLSTEVSSSKDVIDDNKYGRTMPINDVVTLSAFLNQIINMKLDIDVYNEFDPLSISWDQCVNEIIL